MTTWEYMNWQQEYPDFSNRSRDIKLAQLGSEGWEMCALRSDTCPPVFYFKRPTPDGEKKDLIIAGIRIEKAALEIENERLQSRVIELMSDSQSIATDGRK